MPAPPTLPAFVVKTTTRGATTKRVVELLQISRLAEIVSASTQIFRNKFGTKAENGCYAVLNKASPKTIMKSAVIVFPFMLFCMMPTHLYSKQFEGFITMELLTPKHSFVSEQGGIPNKLLINKFDFTRISILPKIAGNFYIGGGFGITDMSLDELFRDTRRQIGYVKYPNSSNYTISSETENMYTIQYNNVSVPIFLSAIYEISDWMFIKLDVDLIDFSGAKRNKFYSENMYVGGNSNYFVSTVANIGSPTLSLNFKVVDVVRLTISCKYNHNAILNNWFCNKVLDAQKELRNEYRQITTVEDINNLFKQNMSYFTIGIWISLADKEGF